MKTFYAAAQIQKKLHTMTNKTGLAQWLNNIVTVEHRDISSYSYAQIDSELPLHVLESCLDFDRISTIKYIETHKKKFHAHKYVGWKHDWLLVDSDSKSICQKWVLSC